MISEQDITQLKAVFPTKQEFNSLSDKHDKLDEKVSGIQEIVGDLRVEVGELNDKVDALASKMDERFESLDIKIDGFVGSVRGLEQENSAGARILERHDRQLTALAEKIGIPLPY